MGPQRLYPAQVEQSCREKVLHRIVVVPIKDEHWIIRTFRGLVDLFNKSRIGNEIVQIRSERHGTGSRVDEWLLMRTWFARSRPRRKCMDRSRVRHIRVLCYRDYPDLDEFGNGHPSLDGCHQRFILSCKTYCSCGEERATLCPVIEWIDTVHLAFFVKTSLRRASRNTQDFHPLLQCHASKRELGFIRPLY
jgi:hypothetical protein